MISLEAIFGVDGKFFGDQREEEMDVFLRFRSSPAAHFEIHGVSIDMLECEKLESLLVKALRTAYFSDTHTNAADAPNFARHMLVPFISYLRERQFPHTSSSQAARQWDTKFVDTLLSAILASNADMSWKRVCRQVMANDFTNTPTFDGSDGIVTTSIESINSLIDATCMGHLDKLTTVLSEAGKLSAWFLPRYVTSRIMNGWTLLHFAAASPAVSAEFYTYLVRRVGCSITACDLVGQNALHVAATCFNHTAIAALTKMPTGAVRATDRNGSTPLHALLRAVSLCNWRRRVSSDNLQSMITAVLPADAAQLLWYRTYQPPAQDGQPHQAQQVASLQSALLFPAVVYTDDFIAEHVLNLARTAPRDATWDRDLLAHIAISCVRCPADRTATVALLLRDFDLIGAAPLLGITPLGVLDTLLCHAVACAGRHAKGGRPQITALLVRLVEQLSPDGTDVALTVAPLVFLYLAVARQDAALLGDILSQLPRSVVHCLVFPPSSPPSASEADVPFQKRFAAFLDESTATEVRLESIPGLTPLSLACVLGSVDVVNVLLRAAYFAQSRRVTIKSSIDNDGRLSVPCAQSEYFTAVRHCVQYGRFDCLRTIRNLCTKEAMFHLYFLEEDAVDGRTIYVALLDAIGTALHRSAHVRSVRHSVKDSVRHRPVADMKAYADCLKLLLETIPPAIDAASLDALRGSYAWEGPGAGSGDRSPAKDEVAERLKSQLDITAESMRGLCARSDAHDAYFTALRSQRRLAEEAVAGVSELKEISERWTHYCGERASLQQQIRSDSTKTALRVMARKNTPDKRWVKLAFCINRLLRVLQVRLPLSSSVDTDLSALPSAIDASGWTAFVAALGRVCKSRDQLDGFVESLAAALEVVGSDRLGQEEVLAVAAVVERLMADNQIPVLMRNGHSPLNVDNEDDVPHYQVNDIRPDHRNSALFTLLSSWLRTVLLAVRLWSGLHSTSAPDLPSGPAGQGVSLLEYVSFCALLEDEHKLRRLQDIHVASGVGAIASPLQRLLRGLHVASVEDMVEESTLDCLVNALRRSGASPTKENEVVSAEKRKVRNAKNLEQVACVLAEFHERLGGTAEGLPRCLFPLCALQMWKAADVVLALCRKSPSSLSRGRCGQSTIVHGSTDPSESLLQLLCAPLVAGTGEFAAVNPLYFAVFHGQASFVKGYLQVFPCTPAELIDLVQFALRVRSLDMVATIVAHSRCAGNSAESLEVDGLPILGYYRTSLFDESDQQRQAQHLSVRGCYRLRSRALAWASLLMAAANEARTQSKQHNTNELAGEPEEVFVVRRDPSSLRRLVLLQDGTEAEYHQVMNDPELVAMALPAPTLVGGLLGTGHTVLHQACRGGHLDLVQELMSLNPEWRSRVLSVDRNGETPLSIAVASGRFELARHLLGAIAEGPGAAGSDKRTLDRLYRTHTAADSSARTRVCRGIVTDAERKLRVLQQGLDVPQVPGAAVYSVLRGYQVESATHVLTRHLVHIEKLWKRLSSADPQLLLHVAHLPACGQLDSIIRARQGLVLLGVPLSQLVAPPRQVGKSTLPAARIAPAMKDFVDLSPQKLRKLVTYPSALQLKSLLGGWYRLRSASAPSALDDTLFLFRNVDVSIQEQGRAGMEASLFLRQRGAYVRACDRVRARGVPSLDPSNPMGNLAHQLSQEMRFDVTSASRENMLRHANLSLLTATDGGSKAQSHSFQISKVLSLLRMMQVDAATCSEVLNLAYLVLDFCRSVCVARLLVAATGEPQSAGSPEHPLDRLQESIITARRNVIRLKSVLATDPVAPTGVLSRLPLCATLDGERLSVFFSLPAEVSTKFSAARGFVLEALSCLLQDQGELPLSEFVCRVAVSTGESGVGKGTDNAADQVNRSEESSAPKNAHTKGARITDTAEGLSRLVKFLHYLTVKDLVYSVGRGALEQFGARNAERIGELNGRHSGFLQLQVDEVTVPAAEPDHRGAQRPTLSLLAGRDKDRAVEKAKTEAETRLRHGYETASTLYRLIAAALALSSQRRLYETDAAMAVQGGQRVDSLSAVCSARSPWWCRVGDNGVEASGLNDRQTAVAIRQSQLSACELLLKLGADPCASDRQAVAPLEIAALSGDVELLRACLDHCDSESLHGLARYETLVWYTLVATAGAHTQNSTTDPDYGGCVLLLLERDFPTAAPAGCDYSALEVALITQARPTVLAALVVRRIVMSETSAQRAMQWLLLREEPAPVQVAEALLYGHDKGAGYERWTAEQPDVLGDICGAPCSEQVIAGTATLLHRVASSVRTVDDVVTRLRHGVAAGLDALAQQRRKRSRHSCATVVRDLGRCSAALQSGALPGDNTDQRVLLWAISASSQQHVVAYVMHTLKDALFRHSDGGNDSPDEVKSLRLNDLICRACYFDNLTLLNALERRHGTLVAVDPEAAAEGKTHAPDDTNPNPDPETDPEAEADEPRARSWSDLLNQTGHCPGLGASLSPLDCALAGRAAQCVAYLCAQAGAQVTCLQAVAAIAKYHLPESTALLVLQRATTDSAQRPGALDGYDCLEDFLSATEHGDLVSGESLLHLCCRRGYVRLVQHLLSLGADVMQEDCNGCSALLCSIAAGHGEVTRVLYPHCPERVKTAVGTLAFVARKALLRRWRTMR